MQKRIMRVAATVLAAALAIGSAVHVNAEKTVEQLEEEKQGLQGEIDDLDAELVTVLTDIEELEKRIADNESRIEDAKADLEAAEKAEQSQHDDMKERVKYMYENSGGDIVSIMASSGDFGEFLNKVDYANSVQQYDRSMLNSYQSTVEGIESIKVELANEQAQLESDKSNLESRKTSLDMMIQEKKDQMADFDAQLEAARQKAEEEARRRQQEQEEANALNASLARDTSYNGTTDYSRGKSSKASGKGTAVARYASKFVGNPYVWGGNSLTEGCDCSGFVVQIYKHFGVDLSDTRTSGELRSVGRGVSFEDIQPGDIVCYDGHVAIYYGNGAICEAQSSRTGITIGRPVAYKEILAIRRIF